MIKMLKRMIALLTVVIMMGVLPFTQISSAKEKDMPDVGSDEIRIDGYYDEWKDFPDTDITYRSNNATCIHKGNIYSDGDYLYVHINMDKLYESQMSFHSFILKVNDQETAIPILGVNDSGAIDWNVPIYGGMSEGTHTNLAVFLGYYTPCDSSVAFTVYDKDHATDTKGDEIEFRISMKDVTKYFGIEADSIDTISVRNPNIGAEALIYAGSSTSPLVGVGIGFVFAVSVIGLDRYRKRRKMVR